MFSQPAISISFNPIKPISSGTDKPAELIAEKIEERVALARSKHAAGEEFDKAVTVLWGISVGKKNIFEEHDTSRAEFDASCEALLNGGGVGSRGADLGVLRAVSSRVASSACPWHAAP